MPGPNIFIIGVGDDLLDGLSESSRSRISQAEVIFAAEPALSRAAKASHAECLNLGGDVDQLVQQIESRRKKNIVVLAPGDPLFYGTARFLWDRLGKEHFEVAPHVSSMQLAFARVKESWDDAYLANLATQPLDRVVDRVRTSAKAGLFTTETATPGVVAKALLDRRIDYFTAYVCENLGSPDERVSHLELEEVAQQAFAPLNVMILVRDPSAPDRPADELGRRLFGNPDDRFLQSLPKRGLLTPAEVRTIALAELDLGPASIVWDVGAGSGSVAIEAARLASAGTTYAIEMDAEDHQLISENAASFGVANLTPVLGTAPDAWKNLPDPDAIFVGGAGRQVKGIVSDAYERLKPGGRLVASVGSVENVAVVYRLLKTLSADTQSWLIQIARGTDQFDALRYESLNPTYLIRARKS